ncbi:50S ribosomal protein L24 [Ereboglobus luteus]|uniref:Large ribosomal subunit protein uL24 n=1 Tax=Ereboglobus luteus TaxID=1796921 RepID=A0A2U8E350_9BACT|nr:50S ribosomal protein L24 [Ereboglobus luteus]AWI09134.1 50S ribosomal protein L24 [Ereboglobus luteus]
MATKFHVKRGDTVAVISGSHKGKSGKILEILPGKQRARVEGLALIKRHTKAQGEQKPGGIIEREGTIHISNLKLQAAAEKKEKSAKK